MIKIILTIVLTITSIFAQAQLLGSGKTITTNYDYKNFDKVYLKDLDGKIEIEIGKSWSISVTIDDNLNNLLIFSENASEHELKIQFKDNKNNKNILKNQHQNKNHNARS